MLAHSLAFLDSDDRAALAARTRRIVARPGEAIVLEGSRPCALFVVQQGFVLVQRRFRSTAITYARMGPGEMFGEMSILEDAAASASVVADGPVEVVRIELRDLEALAAERPRFGERLHRSLAVALARRLRETAGRLVAVTGRHALPSPLEATGGLGPPLPPDLEEAAERVRLGLRGLDDGLRGGTLSPVDVPAALDATLAPLVAAVRGRGDEAGGVVRRLFGELVSSRTLARLLVLPPSQLEPSAVVERARSAEPAGDGRLGQAIDAWFLGLPSVASRAEVDRWLSAWLRARIPGAISLLGAASAPILLEALRADPTRAATVIDGEDGVLLAIAEEAANDVRERVTWLALEPTVLFEGPARFAVLPQAAVVVPAALDALPQEGLVKLVEWGVRSLLPGGALVLTGVSPAAPDAGLLGALGWVAGHATPERLALVREAAPGAAIDVHRVGTHLVLTATRAD